MPSFSARPQHGGRRGNRGAVRVRAACGPPELNRRAAPAARQWLVAARRLLLVLTVIVAAACVVPAFRQVAPPGMAPVPPLAASLSRIEVVAHRHKQPGYARVNFGPGWASAMVDGHSCTTRTRELAAHLYVPDGAGAAVAPAEVSPQCRVTGAAQDPYSGRWMASGDLRGAEPIELDHVFPLSAAWDMGAAQWDDSKRVRFANDPANLIAVTRQQNQEKSDALPAQWLPAKETHRCWYVRAVAAVAAEYGLALSAADVAVARRVCWAEQLWQ